VGELAFEEIGKVVRILVLDSIESKKIVDNSMELRYFDKRFSISFISYLRGREKTRAKDIEEEGKIIPFMKRRFLLDDVFGMEDNYWLEFEKLVKCRKDYEVTQKRVAKY